MSEDQVFHFMGLALDQARKAAALGEVPVGSVLVDSQGRVLAQAHNLVETRRDPCAHAEIIALREAAKAAGAPRLVGCSLFSTLEPCLMCAGALVLARVQRLVYAAADPKGGACGTLYDVVRDARLNHRLEVQAGVRADESADLLRAFFRARR